MTPAGEHTALLFFCPIVHNLAIEISGKLCYNWYVRLFTERK